MQTVRLAGKFIALLGACVLNLGTNMENAKAESLLGIISPANGVICDQQRSICYNREGPSVSLTQLYLGQSASNRLMAQLRGSPTNSDLLLSNGALCDLRSETCWSDGFRKNKVDSMLSQQLFGSSQPSSGAYVGGLQGLETPRAGVVCDTKFQTCWDQNGLSLGLTREFFGSNSEQMALRSLQGQSSRQQFRMSNGSYCDDIARTCWSAPPSRQQVNTELSNQLFGLGGVDRSPWIDNQDSKRRFWRAQCRVSRGWQTLFRGNCELSETSNNLGRLLNLRLDNGSIYSISRPRTGNFELTDPQGKIWPLQVKDQAQTLKFTWSDHVLNVSETGASNTGFSLGELIDTLLGQ